MNERIKELIAQATRIIEPNDPDYKHEIFDKEKFAELIVKECAKIAADSGDTVTSFCISDYFGVEK